MEAFLLWVVFAVLVAWWASNRGRSWFGYFLISFFLTPLVGGIILAILPDLKKEAAKAAKQLDDTRRHEQERNEAREQIESIRALTTPTSLARVSVADELIKLAKLRDDGLLTAAEFDEQKAVLLASRRSV